MGSGIPRTNGICVMACLYATSITSSSLVVSDNCRVKTCSPSYVSQCNLWLSGFAGHIIIKTRKNPEDLTEVRVLTAFQRIANKNCLHDLLIFWRSKPVWLLFWNCRLHIESESVRGVRWEKKYGGKLFWLQLLAFKNFEKLRTQSKVFSKRNITYLKKSSIRNIRTSIDLFSFSSDGMWGFLQ